MKTNDCCPICSQPPGQCFLICPQNDPYGGDQKLEEADFVPDANPYGFSEAGDLSED